VEGQSLNRLLADLIVDPFVEQEIAEQFGVLSPHYQVPLVDGNDVFMEFKTGTYISCDPPGWMTTEPCGVNTWHTQIWNERRLHWQGGRLVEKWNFASDWKPPQVPALNLLGPSEPVFHALLANGYVYVPGAGGTLFKLSKGSGKVVTRINPFGAIDPRTYEVGPPVADQHGNIYYQAITLAPSNPWSTDIEGAWLIKVRPDDTISKVSFTTLAVGAPAPSSPCKLQFSEEELPWPPSPTAEPPSVPCGSQRPSVNAAPAVALDGTVYVVSRAHRADRYSYLLAVNPDLTPRWAASFRDRLSDGCGTATLPPTGTLGGCRAGAPVGVDPATNELPAGRVVDTSTSSPVVTPDGSILYGAYTEYNKLRGKLFKFSAAGQFLGTYNYGLDVTPNIYEHDGTYSIILKDNYYGFSSYCTNPVYCPFNDTRRFYVSQLAPNLTREWWFRNPEGFEWCINAAAVDKNGTVYANAEDGYLYAIGQGAVMEQRIFLEQPLGAAYTPLSIGPDGRIYTQNAGHLLVAGE
jgi:hypothetical protein